MTKTFGEPASRGDKRSWRLSQKIPTTASGSENRSVLATSINEMHWITKKYRIRFENGGAESVTGSCNGLFGLSADGVLTHLQTGYRVARFPDQAAGRAAGDHLAAAYAEEFEALNKAFREAMTYDQFRSLAEVADLNRKINGDRDFNRRLLVAGVGLTGGNR